MSEKKTIYKWLWAWDFEKEEKWLNTMAMEGWTLCEVGFCKYVFEKTEPGEYIVRLEMHQKDRNYEQFMNELGAETVGRVAVWVYFRRKASEGSFDLFSDIDSRIEHLNRIAGMMLAVTLLNLGVGLVNVLNPAVSIGWINLLLATLLTYGLGRIHGKKESLEKERDLRE